MTCEIEGLRGRVLAIIATLLAVLVAPWWVLSLVLLAIAAYLLRWDRKQQARWRYRRDLHTEPVGHGGERAR